MAKRLFFIAALFAAASLRAAESLPSRGNAEVSDSPLSVDFETFLHDPLNASLTDEVAGAVAQSGTKWARVMANWDFVERSTGVYTYQGLDNLMNRLKSHGFKIFMTLNGGSHGGAGGGSPFYAGGNSPTSVNGALPPWLNFVDATVRRYRGDVSCWEIWNEPNLDWQPAPNPANYAALAQVTIQKVKSLQPGATIILGGTALVDKAFLTAVLPVVGGDIDALGLHPYRQYPEQSQDDFVALYPFLKPNAVFTPVGATSYTEEIAVMRALLAGLGLSKVKIWSTEAGYASQIEASGLFPGTETKQAKNLCRYFLLNRALGIERSSWFRALDQNLLTNAYTPTGQSWVESYTAPSYMALGQFATFAPLVLDPTTSLVVPTTSTSATLNIAFAGSTLTATNATNYAQYSIAVPTPGDYFFWFRLKGPDASTYGYLNAAVNGSSGTSSGALSYIYGAFSGLAAGLQGQSDLSKYYYSPLINVGLVPGQELPYHPAFFTLSGTATLKVQINSGSLSEIRLVRRGDLARKKSFTALSSLASVLDDRVGPATSHRPTFANVNLSTAEWQSFQSAAYLTQGRVPLVAYWIGTPPADVFAPRSVRVSLPVLKDPVLIDPVEGTFQTLDSGGEFTLPATDSPLLLTGRAALQKSAGRLLPPEEVYNYPNPARTGNTTIRFFLSQSAGVTLRIFNAAHEEIHHASLEGALGRNAYDWSTADAANGVYFCKITAGGEDVVLKILVLR